MLRVKTSLGFRVAIGLIALAPPAVYGALAATAGNRGARVPELDYRHITGWIGERRAITEGRGGRTIVDLDTGSVDLASESEKDLSGNYLSGPYPSPDGRWLLFAEWSRGQRHRFVLASTEQAASLWKRCRGLLALEPIEAIAWLPDSSGWVVQRRDAPGCSVQRYTRAAPNTPDRPIPAPRTDSVHPEFTAILPDGTLVFRDGALVYRRAGEYRIAFVPPNPATPVQDVAFSPATAERFLDHRRFIERETIEADTGLITGLRSVLHLPSPRTRFVYDALTRPAQTLWTLPNSVGEYAVTPDGTTLIYWSEGKAYRLPLPLSFPADQRASRATRADRWID